MRIRIQRGTWQRACGTAAAALMFFGCSPEKPSGLVVGSGEIGSNYSATATAIARVVREGAPELGLKDVATTGSIANVDGVLSGDLAFGLAQDDVAFRAVNGAGHWEERGPQTQLRAVFSIYAEAVTVIAPRDSGIDTTRDLIGKRIDIGPAGSGGQQNAIDVLDALGVDWRSETTVHQKSAAERSKMYLGGELDAFFLTAGHPTRDILFAVNSGPGARLIELAEVDEVIRRHPYFAQTTIPLSLYPGLANSRHIATVGVKTVLVTSASVPEAAVYALTRSVFEQLESLGKFDAVLQDRFPKAMVKGMSAPLHPGAERYFREVGLIGDAE